MQGDPDIPSINFQAQDAGLTLKTEELERLLDSSLSMKRGTNTITFRQKEHILNMLIIHFFKPSIP